VFLFIGRIAANKGNTRPPINYVAAAEVRQKRSFSPYGRADLEPPPIVYGPTSIISGPMGHL